MHPSAKTILDSDRRISPNEHFKNVDSGVLFRASLTRIAKILFSVVERDFAGKVLALLKADFRAFVPPWGRGEVKKQFLRRRPLFSQHFSKSVVFPRGINHSRGAISLAVWTLRVRGRTPQRKKMNKIYVNWNCCSALFVCQK